MEKEIKVKYPKLDEVQLDDFATAVRRLELAGIKSRPYDQKVDVNAISPDCASYPNKHELVDDIVEKVASKLATLYPVGEQSRDSPWEKEVNYVSKPENSQRNSNSGNYRNYPI